MQYVKIEVFVYIFKSIEISGVQKRMPVWYLRLQKFWSSEKLLLLLQIIELLVILTVLVSETSFVQRI